jgi:hypothetical protein
MRIAQNDADVSQFFNKGRGEKSRAKNQLEQKAQQVERTAVVSGPVHFYWPFMP